MMKSCVPLRMTFLICALTTVSIGNARKRRREEMKLFCSFSVRGGTLVTVSKRLDKHVPRVVGLKMATYYIFIKNSCLQCLFRH